MILLQQSDKVAEHAAADSVSGSAIEKALSAAAVVNWKIAITILAAAALVGIMVLIFLEWRTIQKAGGLKKWVNDVPVVQYRTVRLIWISEIVVIVLTGAVVAHAVWPQVVGETQTDMVYALFAFLGFGQGMNVTAFLGKRATEDPVIAATNAALADPTVQPFVTSNKKTGERTVSIVPTQPNVSSAAAVATSGMTAEMPAPVVAAPVTVVAPPPAPPVIVRDA